MNWGYLVAWLTVTDTIPTHVVYTFFLGTVWYVLPSIPPPPPS